MSQVVEVISPSLHAPPLEDDYVAAVVRVMTWVRRGEQHLLFATIELYPRGVPAPDQPLNHAVTEGSQTLHFMRWTCSVLDAVAWRGALLAGREHPVETLPDGLGDVGLPLRVGALQDESPWPLWTLVTGSEVPFLARWHGQPRVHHAIPSVPPFEANPLERDRITRWIAEHAFFSFEDYPELLGSVHVIAPNPVLADVRERIVTPPQTPDRDRFVIALQPRPGMSLDGLTVTLRSQSPSGVRVEARYEVKERWIEVAFDHRVHQLATELTDERRGLLHVSPPGTFWRQGEVGVSVGEIRSGVPLAGRPRRLPPARRVTDLLAVAVAARASRSAARARPIFDRGGVWEAFERELLTGIHGYLLVTAPTFSSRDLDRLRAWAASAWSQVSALAQTPLTAPMWPEHFDELPGRLEVRVAAGAPPLQGSFLVTNTGVWFFSGEVATLGREDTFVHAVAEPEPVRERLLAAWHGATPVRWANVPTVIEDAAE